MKVCQKDKNEAPEFFQPTALPPLRNREISPLICFNSLPVKRSLRRKNIAIRLQANGHAEILAPIAATADELQRAFKKFQPWLQKKLRQLASAPLEEQCFEFDFNIGKSFFYCGELYELKHCPESSSRTLVFQNGAFWSTTDNTAEIPELFEAFYRHQARRLIASRLETFTRQFAITIGELSINGARRRFGSCNSRGDLNFSWHLAMYPPQLIDLVVLHELAHRSEMNHSARFYKVLASYLPEHLKLEKELKIWSRKLSAYPA